MGKCSQCINTAMYTVDNFPLCLHCYEKLVKINQTQAAQSAAMINYLVDSMYHSAGLISTSPRMELPQPTYQLNQMKFNNITVDNSVVGAISTGDASTVDVALTDIRQQGQGELSNAIATFINALLKSREIEESTRNELLEQLAFISTEKATQKPRTRLIHAILESIGRTTNTVSGLASLWENVISLWN